MVRSAGYYVVIVLFASLFIRLPANLERLSLLAFAFPIAAALDWRFRKTVSTPVEIRLLWIVRLVATAGWSAFILFVAWQMKNAD